MNIHQLFQTSKKTLVENAPAILVGSTIVGVIGTGVAAGVGGYRAGTKVSNINLVNHEENEDAELLTRKDVAKATWKLYIPATLTGAGAITCVVFAHRTHTKRAAAVVAAYTLTSQEFSEYRNKMVEKLGEKKEAEAAKEIVEKKVQDTEELSKVIMVGDNKILCFDTVVGKYFESDMESIRKAQNDINDQAIHHMYASQNDFFRLLGVSDAGSIGEDLGWRADALLDVSFTSVLAQGKPCMAITYELVPLKYS